MAEGINLLISRFVPLSNGKEAPPMSKRITKSSWFEVSYIKSKLETVSARKKLQHA